MEPTHVQPNDPACGEKSAVEARPHTVLVNTTDGVSRWWCGCGAKRGGYRVERVCRAEGLVHQQAHTAAWDALCAHNADAALQRLEDAVQRSCEAIYAQREGYWPNESERHRIAIALLAHTDGGPRG